MGLVHHWVSDGVVPRKDEFSAHVGLPTVAGVSVSLRVEVSQGYVLGLGPVNPWALDGHGSDLDAIR